MTAHPATVDDYVAALPDDARAHLDRVRRLVLETVPGATESISYGMPTFTVDGRKLVHVGAWKQHLGLYPLPAMPDDLAREAAPYRGTENTLRLPYREELPTALLGRVLELLVQQRTADR